MVSSGLATYKSPRALDGLLIYQQPSSTTLYYSYQERLSLTEAGLRNEIGEITDNTINHTKGACCPSSTSSFPEDCARLKLSSARASQAGLKEMMMQMKNERISEQWSRKTTPHYSYLRMLALAETRLRNEAREIAGR